MKTLVVTTITKDSPGAGQFTIVGTYSDTTPGQPAQRVTVGEFPSGNALWSRGHRLTEALLLCVRGATMVGMTLASWSKVAMAFETALTYIPKINTQPASASCVHSSTAATFNVTDASSELTATYQWQYNARASGVLTSDNTNVSDGDTVVVGTKTYTFKTALTPTEGQVLIGANADASLLNLIRAINHTGTPDTDYKCAAANADATADSSVTSHTITVRAIATGTSGNSLATTETSSHLSWGAALMANGGWTNASGTVNGCVFTNGTTATLTCTPTTTALTATEIRCQITNSIGTSTTDGAAVLTIT